MSNRSLSPTPLPNKIYTLPPHTIEVLTNGVTLHTYSGGEQPICVLKLVFVGGYIAIANQAVQKLYARLLCEGTTLHTPAEISEMLDYNGCLFGPEITPEFTGMNMFMLNEQVPSILDIFAEIYSSPLFGEHELEAAKVSEIAKLRYKRMQPVVSAGRTGRALITGAEHPTAIEVDEEMINAVTRDDLLEFHRRVSAARGCHAYLSGQLTPKVIEATKEFLLKFPIEAEPARLVIKPYCSQRPQTVIIEHPKAVQCAVSAFLPAVLRSHPDYLPLRLTIVALGGYFGSRLMTNVREEKGLTYGISANLFGGHQGSIINIEAQCDSAYVQQVIEELKAELTALVTNPPCGEELERIKNIVCTEALATLDRPDSIMSYIASMKTSCMPDNYFDNQQVIAQNLTPEKIAEMASRYLNPTQLRIAIAGAVQREAF